MRRKVLIFCQYQACMDLLEAVPRAEVMGLTLTWEKTRVMSVPAMIGSWLKPF